MDPARILTPIAQMRWFGLVAYDGTEFYGWQSQAGGNTIQDFLETRLGVIFAKATRVHGSGRTDSGAHARAQAFHFDGDWGHGVEKLLRALRCGLPRGIQVVRLRPVPNHFHARYSACGKRYLYRIHEGYASPFLSRFLYSLGNRPLNDVRMREGARLLLGRHDFRAFSSDGGEDREEDPVKDLRRLEVRRHGRQLTVTTEASGYLYKMVRSLAGALIDVGTGKLQPEDLASILESRRRTSLVVTAPAKGLTLDRVFYPPEAFRAKHRD